MLQMKVGPLLTNPKITAALSTVYVCPADYARQCLPCTLTNRKYHSMLPKLFLNINRLQSFLLLMVTRQLNSDISQSLA